MALGLDVHASGGFLDTKSAGSAANALATTPTFCWLPPLRLPMAAPGDAVLTPNLSIKACEVRAKDAAVYEPRVPFELQPPEPAP